MADVAQTVVVMASWLQDSAARVHPAIRNLRELQPGFPTSTPGSGSVGSGGGGGSSSITERLAIAGRSISEDDAVRDLARIRTLTKDLEPRLRELHDLTMRWGFRTAGEFSPGAPSPRPAADREAGSNRDRWCTSCERIKIAEPVGDRGRNGMCRWCDDFVKARGGLPSLAVLDAHHRGIRITEAMLKDASTPTPRKRSQRRRKVRR